MSSSNSLVILQLGDVHFPTFNTATTDVDNHDRATPGGLDKTLGLPVPGAIRNAIVAQLIERPDAVVAICGDITTRADREQYVQGVRYLSEVLSDPRLDTPPMESNIHAVPGNHDVDFKGDQPFSSFDDLSRFKRLAEVFVDAGLGDVLAVGSRNTTHHLPNHGGLSVMSLNTCRGAGATRRDLPTGQRDFLLDTALAHVPGSTSIEDEVEEVEPGVPLAETLDVPLLHPVELDEIARCWGSLDARTVPVVLAHHGLLPQHTPRLNPYTEMANAGQARKELAKLSRPLIYLHGHIHEHVVEIVDFPRSADQLPMHDRAVIVAAPELKEGFNKIVVHFDPEGYPLGLRVDEYRIRHGEQTVSLIPGGVQVSLARRPTLTGVHRKLLAYLVAHGSATGAELVEHGASDGIHLNAREVEAAVQTLCWTGLLKRADSLTSDFARTGFLL